MASIKNLKKNIKDVIEDIIDISLVSANGDEKKTEAIIDEAIMFLMI